MVAIELHLKNAVEGVAIETPWKPTMHTYACTHQPKIGSSEPKSQVGQMDEATG